MWIKLLLSGLIIAFCIFIGYLAANKYRLRKKMFTQLALFNERYLTELTYSRKPLSEFIREYEYTGDFGKNLESYIDTRNTDFSYSYLSGDEKKWCDDYFGMLGKGDSASQKAFFSTQKAVLENRKTESERDAKSRGELYLKLGLLAGLAIVILII